MDKRRMMVVLAVLAGVSGCGKSDKNATVASVNGRAISRAEFEAYLKFKRVPEADKTLAARALDQYLEREALTASIKNEKSFDRSAIETELREVEKELVISRYFDKVLADKVNDQAVRGYYQSNAAKYEENKIHVAHVLFRTHPGLGEQERKAKLTAARDAYSRLQKGEDFAKVAAALSEDRVSGPKGGDLGLLREGSVDPRFSEKVFALKEGEISEPFESSFGFHVVKVLEAPRRVSRPFDAVQGDIRYQLRASTKAAEAERLQAQAKIERSEAYKSADKPAEKTSRNALQAAPPAATAISTAKP